MKWPRKSAPQKGNDNRAAELYRFLRSYAEHKSGGRPELKPEELRSQTVTLLRFESHGVTLESILKGVQHAWEELHQFGVDQDVQAYAPIAIERGPCNPIGTGMLLQVWPLRVSSSELLSDQDRHPIAVWLETLGSDNAGWTLNFRAVGFSASGPYALKLADAGEISFQIPFERLVETLFSNLRLYCQDQCQCAGFFPDSLVQPGHLELPPGEMTLPRLNALLSKLAVSHHLETVMTFKITGSDPAAFVLESEGHMRSGERRQFHSGTHLIQSSNVAYTQAVRWVADYAMLVVFKAPVEYRAVNYDHPSWTQKQLALSLSHRPLYCDDYASALQLKCAFDMLIEPLERNTNSETPPHGATPSASGSTMRYVEEPD